MRGRPVARRPGRAEQGCRAGRAGRIAPGLSRRSRRARPRSPQPDSAAAASCVLDSLTCSRRACAVRDVMVGGELVACATATTPRRLPSLAPIAAPWRACWLSALSRWPAAGARRSVLARGSSTASGLSVLRRMQCAALPRHRIVHSASPPAASPSRSSRRPQTATAPLRARPLPAPWPHPSFRRACEQRGYGARAASKM